MSDGSRRPRGRSVLSALGLVDGAVNIVGVVVLVVLVVATALYWLGRLVLGLIG